MSWKGFKNWLLGPSVESPLKDWEPGRILPFPTAPQEPAAWSDDVPSNADAVETVGLPNTTDGESDPSSDESEETGSETMTVSEPLEHAEYLPGSTFRVFPTASNHRNTYDSAKSARAAVVQRRTWKGPWNREALEYGPAPEVRVYEAETVWRDVTAEYVK